MYTGKLTRDKLHIAHRPTSLEPICVVIIVNENVDVEFDSVLEVQWRPIC